MCNEHFLGISYVAESLLFVQAERRQLRGHGGSECNIIKRILNCCLYLFLWTEMLGDDHGPWIGGHGPGGGQKKIGGLIIHEDVS